MAESKTYVFGEGGQSGFDPNILLAGMMNGGGFGGFGGGNWLLPFFLLALWGNNGWGGSFGGGGNGYLYVGLGCVLAGLFAHIFVNKKIR